MQIISIVQVLNVVLDQSPERKIAVAAINNGKIFHFIFFYILILLANFDVKLHIFLLYSGWRYVLQQPPVHQPVDLRTPGINV